MDRTIRVRLQTTLEQAHALHETMRQLTVAFNLVCRYGFEQAEKNGVALHDATYYETKALYPGLVSDLLIQARTKATEVVKGALMWKKKHADNYAKKVANATKHGKPALVFKPVKCPQSMLCPARYNEKTYTLKGSTLVSDTFESLYGPLLKEVFTEQARKQIARGADALSSAHSYAELGKPDFTLAFLLLAECSEEEKRETLAYAYERRAALAQEKAQTYSLQFHRPFPLIKLEARKDELAAQAVRQGQPVQETTTKFSI